VDEKWKSQANCLSPHSAATAQSSQQEDSCSIGKMFTGAFLISSDISISRLYSAAPKTILTSLESNLMARLFAREGVQEWCTAGSEDSVTNSHFG
jgi:hypothetical protein